MKNIFKKYIHSVINPEEFERFVDFLLTKENTNRIYQMMEPEWNSSMKAEIEPNPEKSYVFQKVLQQILRDEANNALRKVKIYSWGLRVAAILVLSLLISSVWLYMQSYNSAGSDWQTVMTPYGAKTQLVMPDGSTAWLNSGSTLIYQANFSKKRQVILKGEAFFDVKKSKIPFEVNTDFAKIKVLGTQFNVLAYPETGFEATLVRGAVQVDMAKSTESQILNPGEQVEIVGTQLVKHQVDTELFISWKDGKMVFRREPFPSLMKRLERWFNVQIEYEPDDFKDLWYSGTIEMETLTEVMEMVSKAAPVRFTFDSKTRVVNVLPLK